MAGTLTLCISRRPGRLFETWCVVFEESPCPRGSSRTSFQVLVLVLVLEPSLLVLVLVLESQVIDNNTDCMLQLQNHEGQPLPFSVNQYTNVAI